MPKNKTRMNRINDEIARETAVIIRSEIADPRIGSGGASGSTDNVVSVLRAETTSDLKICKIYVSVLGDDKRKQDAMEALKSASGFIRKRIAEAINLRNTPEIKFVFDDMIEYSMRMHKLIDDVNKPAAN